MPFDLTQSPRAQDMQAQSQGPVPDDEDAIFKDSIGKLAYKTLIKSFPEMASDVVTFKVLDAEARSGRGIGAFVVKQPQGVIYIPAVVSDNAMKPLDMFYCRRHDAFFPLTPDYLRLTTKGALTDIGTPVERPSSLRSNALIMPFVPGLSGMGGLGAGGMGGRFVYAEEEVDASTPFRVVAKNDGHGSYGPKLAEALGRASDGVKLAFARCLNSHPALRSRAVEIYGKAKLAEMVAPRDGKEYKRHIGGGAYHVWSSRAAFDRKEKPRFVKEKAAAFAESPAKKDVFMMTAATPIQEAKKQLDPGETAAAFKSVAYHGYYLKDRRKKTESVFAFAETAQQYETPSEPGIYTVFLRTGPAVALVVPNPVCVGGCHTGLKDSYLSARESLSKAKTANHFLVVFKDGKAVTVDRLVAEARPSQSSTKEIKKFLGDRLTDSPENNSYGCAIAIGSMTVRATEPCSPWTVTSSDGVTTFDACGTTVTVDHNRDDAKVFATSSPSLIRLGGAFKWLRLSRDYDLSSKHFLVSQDEVLRFAEYALAKSGAKPVEVKTAGDGYVVGGRGRAVSRPEALYKVATEYNISIPYADTALKLAEQREAVKLWVKKADGEGQPAPVGPDPSQGQAQPAAPPAAPSPIDLAVAEQMQLLQQQAASIQQQMQSLQTVQARAQQIASGGGAMAAPVGAAAMAAGGQPAPQAAPQPGMDPSQAQGAAPAAPPTQAPVDPSQAQGQAQPGMDPSQAQTAAPPPGMDPSQGAQPGVDPSQAQGQEPPMASMTEEPSPDNIEGQINPQFLESAAQLNDDNVFDAAAVASIAQQKNLGSLTQSYTPSLEKALDNLGRILLLFYVNESELKESMGQDAYNDTEEKLRDTFRGLGDVMLNVNIEPGQIGATPAQN